MLDDWYPLYNGGWRYGVGNDGIVPDARVNERTHFANTPRLGRVVTILHACMVNNVQMVPSAQCSAE